jgi:hypothetical protein
MCCTRTPPHRVVGHGDSRRLGMEVQDLALEIKALSVERDQQGVAGKETRSIRDRIKTRRTAIRKKVEEMALWRQVGWTGEEGLDAAPAFTEAQVEAMVEEGVFPAGMGMDHVQACVQEQRLGKRYYMVCNDLERCMEEEVFLRQEVCRVDAWAAYMLARCEEGVNTGGVNVDVHMADAAQPQVPHQLLTPAEGARAIVLQHAQGGPDRGRVWFLRQHMRALGRMQRQLARAVVDAKQWLLRHRAAG